MSEINKGLVADITMHVQQALEAKGVVAVDHLEHAQKLLQELYYIVWNDYHVSGTVRRAE